MAEMDALALLQRKLGSNANGCDATELVQVLDNMPLAISQAAAYITQRAPQMTIARYVEEVRRIDYDRTCLLAKDGGDSCRDGKASNSIMATWQISFEHIRRSVPTAALLLSLMSLFDCRGIAGKLFHYQYVEDEGTKATFGDDIKVLTSYSLVEVTADDNNFEVHQLVRSSMKRWIELHKEIEATPEETAVISPQNAMTTNVSQDERLRKIQNWLLAPDPSLNFQRALKQRQNDTGLWLLEGEQYESWKKYAASYLWLHGIPGCGKTVLCSTITQDILQHCSNHSGHALAYFYFDFNDEQKQHAEPMLRSLVFQLSQQSMDMPTGLDILYSSHEEGKRQPSPDVLLKVARQMMRNLSQVYIVMDALDECAQPAQLMEMLETMAKWQLQNMHLIVTSRREHDIATLLDEFMDPENTICLQSKIVDKDIQQYVRKRLSDDKDFSKWRKDSILQQEIETALIKGSRGM
jgi:hypothetical protein